METNDFSLQGDYVELNQLLKLVGACDSGGAGKMLVASGAVKVDGKSELRKTCKIRAGQTVSVGDLRIRVLPSAAGQLPDSAA
jgi:ribosome-associated protein